MIKMNVERQASVPVINNMLYKYEQLQLSRQNSLMQKDKEVLSLSTDVSEQSDYNSPKLSPNDLKKNYPVSPKKQGSDTEEISARLFESGDQLNAGRPST
eukprot:UN02693